MKGKSNRGQLTDETRSQVSDRGICTDSTDWVNQWILICPNQSLQDRPGEVHKKLY